MLRPAGKKEVEKKSLDHGISSFFPFTAVKLANIYIFRFTRLIFGGEWQNSPAADVEAWSAGRCQDGVCFQGKWSLL